MSPTQRTLKRLRDQGWPLVQVVETTIPHTFIKRDLFQFIDVLAICGDEVLGVQTTSGANVSARLQKMRTLPSVAHWLASKTRRIEIHGWRKVGEQGKRKLWECRCEQVEMILQPNGETLADFVKPQMQLT